MAPAASMFLAHRLVGRDNNLNLIRMVLALGVLLSHTFAVTSTAKSDPVVVLTGQTLGWFCVSLFFFISGLLVSLSFARRSSPLRWTLARFLRVFPGLAVVLLLSALVLGPLTTTLPISDYFSQSETWAYLPRNLTLAKLQYDLPGVFLGNPAGNAVNGSLWTLFYEVTCYGGVLLAGVLGLLHRPRLMLLATAAFALAYVLMFTFPPELPPYLDPRIYHLLRLAFPFLLGMLAFVFRERVRLDWRILPGLLLAGAIVLAWTGRVEALLAALCYLVLLLAFSPSGLLRAYNRLGDYSYGTYIYAFPMQQLAVFLWPGQEWYANFALALIPTLVLAVLSWKLVERPSLAMVGSLADRLVTRRAPPLVEDSPS